MGEKLAGSSRKKVRKKINGDSIRENGVEGYGGNS